MGGSGAAVDIEEEDTKLSRRSQLWLEDMNKGADTDAHAMPSPNILGWANTLCVLEARLSLMDNGTLNV